MCPYCEKTFKSNVNCKKHMKTHLGLLTAQNPIGELWINEQCKVELIIVFCTGKFPPDVILENPANLHSETISSDISIHVENSLRGM